MGASFTRIPGLPAIRPVQGRQWALAVLGLGLVWQVTTRCLAEHLARTDPAAALAIDSSLPSALLAAANSAIKEARLDTAAVQTPLAEPSGATGVGAALSRLARHIGTPESGAAGQAEESAAAPPPPIPHAELASIRASVEAALARDPLNATALRLMGQMAIETGDAAAADRLMAAAAHRSLREGGALFWLMHRSFARNDHAEALAFADALLRSRTTSIRHVMPLLGRMLPIKESHAPLVRILATGPPWRSLMFASLEGRVADARAPLTILMALEETAAPATAEEVASYLAFLVRHKRYELAYYAWLQFLTPEEIATAGRLFNGSFESAPSGMPFDWKIKQGTGVTVDRVSRDGSPGQHALALDFGHGRVDFSSVEQMTLLSPGNYRLEGEYKGQISGRRGLVWRVVCVESGKVIGQSPMVIGVIPQWRGLEAGVTVPPTGCRAQMVRLDLDARSASEQMITGSISFDAMSITRVR